MDATFLGTVIGTAIGAVAIALGVRRWKANGTGNGSAEKVLRIAFEQQNLLLVQESMRRYEGLILKLTELNAHEVEETRILQTIAEAVAKSNEALTRLLERTQR